MVETLCSDSTIHTVANLEKENIQETDSTPWDRHQTKAKDEVAGRKFLIF